MILAQIQIKVHVDVYGEEVVIVVGSCLVVLPAAILVSLNVLIVCDLIEFLLSIGMRIGSFRAIVLPCPLLRSTSLNSCSRRCSSVYQVLHRDWSWWFNPWTGLLIMHSIQRWLFTLIIVIILASNRRLGEQFTGAIWRGHCFDYFIGFQAGFQAWVLIITTRASTLSYISVQ